MVEETNGSTTKTKNKTARPKPVFVWSVADVVKWLRRYCGEECLVYADNFVLHEINGRALIRCSDNALMRLGVTNPVHRREILRQIVIVRLKTDTMEIMDLERQNDCIFYD